MDQKRKEEYLAWYTQQYRTIIGIDEAVQLLGKSALAASLRDIHLYYSSIWRYETLYLLRYNVPLERTGFIACSFRLTNSEVAPPNSLVYAILYSRFRSPKSQEVEHLYATVYPTLVSKDGEYRSGLVHFSQFTALREKYPEQYLLVEQAFQKRLQKGKLHIQRDVMYPEQLSGVQRKTFEREEARQAMLLLCMHWVVGAHRLDQGLLENHVVANYRDIVLGRKWKTLLSAVNGGENAGLKISKQFFRYATRYQRPGEDTPIELIGQKLTLLNLGALQRPDDAENVTWRETHTANHVADMVINGITPSAPIYGDYFLIAGVTQGVFDNPDNQSRVSETPAAQQAISSITTIRQRLYRDSPGLARLSDRMADLQQLAMVDTISSEYAMCTVTEAVGRTWGDLFLMLDVQNHAHVAKQVGPLLTEPWMIRRYLFDMCNFSLMLQSKLGVLHADLHLNNCTLFAKVAPIKDVDGTLQFAVPNPRIVYRLGDHFYVFPHYGRTAAYIDFSRAITFPPAPIPGVGEPSGEDHPDPLVPPMGSYELESYLLRQKFRVDALLQQVMADFARDHRDQLSYAYFQHPQDYLRALSCTDILRFVQGLGRLLEHAPDYAKPTPEVTSLLAGLERTLTERTRRDLLVLISPAGPKEAATTGLYQVMQDFFREDLVEHSLARRVPGWDTEAPITVIDYFSSRNPLRYNTRQVAHFPPQLDVPKLRKYLDKLDPSGVAGYESFRQAQRAAPAQMEVVVQETQAKIDHLLGPPPAPQPVLPPSDFDIGST